MDTVCKTKHYVTEVYYIYYPPQCKYVNDVTRYY